MPAEFDEHMRQRLRAFQEHHGLAGDGVAGPRTWSKLAAGQPAGPGHHAGSAPTTAGRDAGGGAEHPMVIPLSDYPHLQALVEAESADHWLASLGIGETTEDEALA